MNHLELEVLRFHEKRALRQRDMESSRGEVGGRRVDKALQKQQGPKAARRFKTSLEWKLGERGKTTWEAKRPVGGKK